MYAKVFDFLGSMIFSTMIKFQNTVIGINSFQFYKLINLLYIYIFYYSHTKYLISDLLLISIIRELIFHFINKFYHCTS